MSIYQIEEFFGSSLGIIFFLDMITFEVDSDVEASIPPDSVMEVVSHLSEKELNFFFLLAFQLSSLLFFIIHNNVCKSRENYFERLLTDISRGITKINKFSTKKIHLTYRKH